MNGILTKGVNFSNSLAWCYLATHLMGGKAEAGAPESVWADYHMRATLLQSESQHPVRVQMHVTTATSQVNQSGYQFPGLYYSHLNAAENQNIRALDSYFCLKSDSWTQSAAGDGCVTDLYTDRAVNAAVEVTSIQWITLAWEKVTSSYNHCSLFSKNRPLTHTDSTFLLLHSWTKLHLTPFFFVPPLRKVNRSLPTSFKKLWLVRNKPISFPVEQSIKNEDYRWSFCGKGKGRWQIQALHSITVEWVNTATHRNKENRLCDHRLIHKLQILKSFHNCLFSEFNIML